MDNVPVHLSQSSAGHSSGGRLNNAKRSEKFKLSRIRIISIVIGIVIALAALIFFGVTFYESTMGSNIDSSKYQSVVLSNNTIYYGKLQALNGGYMKLTDIYYLEAKNDTATTDSSLPDLQLVKRGDEVQGPVDEMIISREQIVFFENLKNDGKVTTAILKYKKQNP